MTTLPPNIKEEIEKEASLHAIEPCGGNSDIFHTPRYYSFIEGATQFYLKGLGDREAIAKAAFEAGDKQKLVMEPHKNGTFFRTMKWDDYLASDEYKKLVGEM